MSSRRARGFTLIELLAALLVLALLALMAYRGLGAVLDSRDHVREETRKWQRIAAFFARFERDVALAAPRPSRTAGGMAPAWLADPAAVSRARLEFSRFASAEGVDAPRRVGYTLSARQEIELWVWPGVDPAPQAQPSRYPVLSGVKTFELRYLDTARAWTEAWPRDAGDPPIPRAVQLRIVLESGEDITRVFQLQS